MSKLIDYRVLTETLLQFTVSDNSVHCHPCHSVKMESQHRVILLGRPLY